MEQIIKDSLAAGAALATQQAGGQFAVVPEGYKLHGLETFGANPWRKKGDVELHDAESFTRYFNRHANEGSQIYATKNPPRFIGVLNDHTNSMPDWKDFRAVYSCPLSHEWKVWAANDGKAMSQVDFAVFIEKNLLDIVHPDSSYILEVSRTLEAKKKVSFASGVRLTNGEHQLIYEEEIQGTTSKGKLDIPEGFVLGVAVLEGGEPYRIEANLRYRIKEATLVMWYELVRPHKILEDAVNQVFKDIENATARQIFTGTP